MKGMVQLLVILFTCTVACSVHAQEIQFIGNAESAMTYYADLEPRTVGHCVDSLVLDTVYVENLAIGEMEMVVHEYPLARYEFYLDGAIFRRIDIDRDVARTDTMMTEDLETGEMMIVIQEVLSDIPNGAYHEFFPNGNIRIEGTLDGYNPDGTLKKTGEWKEWDATGNVIRQETYP